MAEQVLDGMLDDNFGNTGTGDFVPLPYVNLVVTSNTPPNLNQLTGDFTGIFEASQNTLDSLIPLINLNGTI